MTKNDAIFYWDSKKGAHDDLLPLGKIVNRPELTKKKASSSIMIVPDHIHR